MTPNAMEGDTPSLDSALDHAAVERLLATLGDEGPALLIAVIHTFLDEAPRLLAATREAVASAQPTATRDGAHSLKSGAAALGATRLSEACSRMETAAAGDDMTAAAELLKRVEAEHETARLALHAAVVDLRAGTWGITP